VSFTCVEPAKWVQFTLLDRTVSGHQMIIEAEQEQSHWIGLFGYVGIEDESNLDIVTVHSKHRWCTATNHSPAYQMSHRGISRSAVWILRWLILAKNRITLNFLKLYHSRKLYEYGPHLYWCIEDESNLDIVTVHSKHRWCSYALVCSGKHVSCWLTLSTLSLTKRTLAVIRSTFNWRILTASVRSCSENKTCLKRSLSCCLAGFSHQRLGFHYQ